MKINGKKLEALALGEVVLPRPGDTKDVKQIRFKIRAITLGDEAKGDKLFPDPRPPAAPKLDGRGLPVRDPLTKQPVWEMNLYDTGYTALQEKASRMQRVVAVVDALEADDTVKWDTTEPRGSVAFYEACFEEMQASGITLGDIVLILNKARELGNLDGKKLEEAAESFS
jgi:hypothetical protein